LLWFAEIGLLPVWNSSTNTERFRDHPIPDVIEIADYVVQLIPESVARENLVIPLAESADALLVAATSPVELEIIEKLQFILNRRILAVPTTKDWIVTQIDKYYGATDDAGGA
jgi:type IV pilus assembly protein PilB